MITKTSAQEQRDTEYLEKPESDTIWLEPKCAGLSVEGRAWAEHAPEDCPECGLKPVRYIRADLFNLPKTST